MNLFIQKYDLNEAVQHISKAISPRSTIPILNGIKIDATDKGVTLTASDTDISIQCFIPLEHKGHKIIQMIKPGSVVLPAKFLMEIIRKLPSETIEIEMNDQFQTMIRSGSSEIQMVGLDAEEYPVLPNIEENKMISMTSVALKTLIKQTSFAVSTSETTPILTGVLWKFDHHTLSLTACDRHRLATKEITINHSPEQPLNPIVIAGKTLNELNKILPDSNLLIDIVISNNQVLFKLENILFFTKILEGAYPDTSKLISQNFQTELVINTINLTDAIDRAYLLSREDKTNIVKLVMKENQTIEISSSSAELGKFNEDIPASLINGELLRISFNSKYMLDALKVLDSESVRLGFTGAMSPIIILPETDASILQLILPYRTMN